MCSSFVKVSLICSFCLVAISASLAKAADKTFSFDDQYIQLEAVMSPGTSKDSSSMELLMTPKPGWKILVDNSSSLKPLRLKFSMSKCLKLKGATRYSPPDLSGTDDSGSYSEHYTRTASIKQDFSKLKCSPKSGADNSATLTYLLCQDNKCVGPFSKVIRFKAE